jgi:signal transduction histidine kinase
MSSDGLPAYNPNERQISQLRTGDSMRHSTRLILWLGFGSLLGLIASTGWVSYRTSQTVYAEVLSIEENYRDNASLLSDIHADVYLSGIIIRDFVLDKTAEEASIHRRRLSDRRSSIMGRLQDLEKRAHPQEAVALGRLRRALDIYWTSVESVLAWTGPQKVTLGSRFLSQTVVPRREVVLQVAREIDGLNAAGLREEQRRIEKAKMGLFYRFGELLGLTMVVGLSVAGISMRQLFRLERRAELQRRRTEHAERELRSLSQQLVQAQEEERKSISRELHDEIGQMLTGLRMELGNLGRLQNTSGAAFSERLLEAKNLTESTLRSVRDMAMGLRPSMLDDLGLVAALEYQAREFSRRSGIEIRLQADGELNRLSEPVRTCIYRVVQESLTNCARHARAQKVQVALSGGQEDISLKVTDDGIGFNPDLDRGLGLIGLEERVKKLCGNVSISSQSGRGTRLEVKIPLEALAREHD